MNTPRRLDLPMAGGQRGGARAGAGLGPDPERVAQGWVHRFVATGERADEMVALYRELGFEVVADPVGGEGLDEGCDVCFSGHMQYRAIYTRRRTDTSEQEGE